ncbi:DUF4153 domain-containing protein [Belliella kenyensis]|uniref:DUF4153 domain-containing protein n=1 Tax=Belliella kenyensis TaxID=1472724 RepID=A0ABV8EMN8_9BACT|nr:DUF4153 domain-containing protein [Belliella kenyensis]MCH7403300.1 DUF4153 domain-containing protein [Belliella kenyensis]MDN3602941.1 DUF4153 domain-containing protein [Belliella kenyensis]
MNRIKSLFVQSEKVWVSYPFTLLCALLATVSAIFAFELEEFRRGSTLIQDHPFLVVIPFVKLYMIFTLGISLFFAVEIIKQFRPWKWLPLVGVVLLFTYFLIFPDDVKIWSSVEVTNFVVIFLLHHLAVSFLPFLLLKRDEISFWSYNKTLFGNLAQTILFVGVLTGGLLLAIAAIGNLFNIKSYLEKYYLYVGLVSSVFGSAFVFLLFCKDGFESMIKDSKVPSVQRFFVQYILIPLILIYGLILYAYMAKIVLLWSLPQGWVSYMVIAYAVLGFVAILLIYPLFSGTSKPWVRIFDRTFFYTMIPVLVLLFVAILFRIFEYGITPNRYFVFILALWIAGVSLYFIFFKNSKIFVIPVTLFVLGFFSISLPYFNAYSVSKRSQMQQFLILLDEFGLYQNSYIQVDKPIKRSDLRRLGDIAKFLARHQEMDFVKNLIESPDSLSFQDPQDFYDWNFTKHFTNIEEDNYNRDVYEFLITKVDDERNAFHDVRNVDYYLTSDKVYAGSRMKLNDVILSIEQNLWDKNEKRKMIFKLESESREHIDSYDLISFLKSKFELKNDVDYEIMQPSSELRTTFKLGAYEFTIDFEEIRFANYYADSVNDNVWSFENVSIFLRYNILVRMNDN